MINYYFVQICSPGELLNRFDELICQPQSLVQMFLNLFEVDTLELWNHHLWFRLVQTELSVSELHVALFLGEQLQDLICIIMGVSKALREVQLVKVDDLMNISEHNKISTFSDNMKSYISIMQHNILVNGRWASQKVSKSNSNLVIFPLSIKGLSIIPSPCTLFWHFYSLLQKFWKLRFRFNVQLKNFIWTCNTLVLRALVLGDSDFP